MTSDLKKGVMKMVRYHQPSYTRKRRHEAGGYRLSVVLRTFAFIAISVFLALFYVWQNVQLVRLGYSIKEKEKMVIELSKRSKAMEIDLSILKMPSRIMSRIKENGLSMELPHIRQIVKVQGDPVLYQEDLVNTDFSGESLRYGHLIRVSQN